jgi:protein SCO1
VNVRNRQNPMARTTPRTLWPVAAAMCAVVVAVAVLTARSAPPRFHGTVYTEVLPAAPFALVDHDGRAVTLESYRGSPVLLFFGFTHCPDVCPLTLAKLSEAVERAGRPARDARILLVTVDPARDTPEVLKAYAARFGARVVGLTGDSLALEQARKGYGAYVVTGSAAAAAPSHAGHADHPPAPAAPRTIHSSVVYGIDRRGGLQVVISETAPVERMAADVRTLSRL